MSTAGTRLGVLSMQVLYDVLISRELTSSCPSTALPIGRVTDDVGSRRAEQQYTNLM